MIKKSLISEYLILKKFKYVQILIIKYFIVAECEENEQDNLEEDWLKLSSDCPYFDSISTSVVNNKNNKRKTYYLNKGGNKRFKKSKHKKYVYNLIFTKNMLFYKLLRTYSKLTTYFVFINYFSSKKKATTQSHMASKSSRIQTSTLRSNVKIPPSNRPGFLSAPKVSRF